MEKFEYKVYTHDTKGVLGGVVDICELQHELDSFGNDGWELVSSVATTQAQGSTRTVLYVFKRRKIQQ